MNVLPPFDTVICDRLGVTAPGKSDELAEQMLSALDGVGAYRLPRGRAWRVGDGTFVAQDVGRGYSRLDFSGGCMRAVREAGRLSRLTNTMALTAWCRVTALDLALDVQVSGSWAVPRIFRKGRRGELRVGRRLMPACDVARYDTLDPKGLPAGTVYSPSLGDRAKLRLVVYCKASEVLAKVGEVIEPRTRFELRLRGVDGVSLLDVRQPAPLFWTKLGNALPRPEGVAEWQPRALVPRPEMETELLATKLDRKIEALRPALEELGQLAATGGFEYQSAILADVADALGVSDLLPVEVKPLPSSSCRTSSPAASQRARFRH